MSKIKGGSQYQKYGRTHYERNKAEYLKKARQGQNDKREYVNSIKKAGKCVDCGIADYRLLDFDHIKGDKLGNISRAWWEGWGWVKIKAEIEKCVLRCSNCHRIKTWNNIHGIVV